MISFLHCTLKEGMFIYTYIFNCHLPLVQCLALLLHTQDTEEFRGFLSNLRHLFNHSVLRW